MKLEKLKQNFKIITNFYFLGKIGGNIISLIKWLIEWVFKKGMIIKGIGGVLLGGGTINFSPLTYVLILIISYSDISKGCILTVHWVNVIQSSKI